MSHADHLLRLADFATGLRYESVPEDVRERARWILADTIGCIVAGNRAPPVRRLARSGLLEASCIVHHHFRCRGLMPRS